MILSSAFAKELRGVTLQSSHTGSKACPAWPKPPPAAENIFRLKFFPSPQIKEEKEI